MKAIMLIIIIFSFAGLLMGECRLLLMLGRGESYEIDTNTHISAFEELEAQSYYTYYGADGWGIAYYEVGYTQTGVGTVWSHPGFPGYPSYESNRFACWQPAYACPEYEPTYDALIDEPTKVILAHIRYGTEGLDNMPNPHPFVFDYAGHSYVFAHNGYIPSFTNVKQNMWDYVENMIVENNWDPAYWEQLLFDDHPIYAEQIDSGIYFAFLMAHIKLNEWDILRGLHQAQNLIESDPDFWDFQKRTFVLSDGFDAYAYRRYDSGDYPLEYYLVEDSVTNEKSALIMSMLPEDIPTVEITHHRELDNNELVYIPNRGESVHFKNFDLPSIIHVKDPLPPYSGAETYWTWDSFPVLDTTVGVSAIDVMTQNYPGGSGIGFFNAVYVINEERIYIIRSEPGGDWIVGTPPLNRFSPKDGYKIKHMEYTSESIAHIAGTICPKDKVYVLLPGQENWVGYWLLNSQSVEQSLGDYVEVIESVEARDWYYRCGDEYAREFPMEFGSMYVISLEEDITEPVHFTWENSRIPSSETPPSQPEYFSYDHGSEYQVIEIEYLAGGENVLEVGVFAGGECIGAATTDSYPAYPVQLLYYPDGYEGLELEFQYYQGGRHSIASSYTTMIYDPDSGEYLASPLRAGERKYNLIRLEDRLKEMDDTRALQFSFYPNPFNPKINISLDLPDTRLLEITIFNIKGQKVRQLVADKFPAGSYKFVWDGRNDIGQSVSSGIYFCRVTAGDNSVTGKIMLLK